MIKLWEKEEWNQTKKYLYSKINVKSLLITNFFFYFIAVYFLELTFLTHTYNAVYIDTYRGKVVLVVTVVV